MALVSDTTVKVRNDTAEAVVARIAPWEDLSCVGYVSTTGQRYELGPRQEVAATITDPGWGGTVRIGAEFYRAGCFDLCKETPFGFAFVDPSARPPSS